MSDSDREHLLFLTGNLAEKQLARTLELMQPTDFSYEIRNIGVNVASLMTAKMISRRLTDLEQVDKVIVPGLCRGDLETVSETMGTPFIRGTIDLKDLPSFFGRACRPIDLSKHSVMIFAEIVDAPSLSVTAILAKAAQYRADGADVIDIGCLPDTPFPHLEDTVRALQQAGHKVSVDSLDSDMLLRGGKAGADYLLSLTEKTLWIAEQVASTPVLIPEPHGHLPSLYKAIEQLKSANRPFLADPILDPIHFGFTDSILRYHQLRKYDPQAKIIIGIGNVTELTEADTTGINAILFGMISELQLDAVLTTQVSPHCRSAIREADQARRIMHAARAQNCQPKGFSAALLGLHSRRPFLNSVEDIHAYYRGIKDPSYRIQVSAEGMHVYNRDGIHCDIDPFALFPKLALLQDDASHAFYMGVQLARAQIAWQLGKNYTQDIALDWGAAGYEADGDINGA